MITIIFTLAFLSLLPPVIVDYRDKSPFIVLWLLNILFVFFPILMNYYNGYNNNIIIYTLLFFISCNLFYFLTILIIRFDFNKNNIKYKIENFPLEGYKHTDKMIFIAILLLILVFFLNDLSLSRIAASTLKDKRELGGAQLYILFLIAYLCPFIIYTFYNKKKILFFLILTSFFVVLFYFRSRALLSFIVLPLAYYLIFWKKRGKLFLFITAFVAYFSSQILKVIRYQGSLSEGLSLNVIIKDLPKMISNSFEKGTGDFSIGTFFLDIIKDSEGTYWYSNFTIPHKLISKVLPFVDSPKTIEYQLWDYYFGVGSNGSLHPTGYGVAYADAGIFGISYFILLAIIRMFFHRYFVISRDVTLLGFVMYFILFFSRGSLYNSLILYLSTFIVWVIFSKFFLKKSNIYAHLS